MRAGLFGAGRRRLKFPTTKSGKVKRRGSTVVYLIILFSIGLATFLLITSTGAFLDDVDYQNGSYLAEISPGKLSIAEQFRRATTGTTPQIKSHSTVVTGFFPIKSKHSIDSYMEWMGTMLGLNDAMIIFTSPDMVDNMTKLRQHAVNRTVVIGLELEDLPMVQNYPLSVWEAEFAKDSEKRVHAGYQVFWIWLSKTFFLEQSATMNPFQSEIFMWSDIGCFRKKSERRWKGQQMVVHPEIIPDGRMLHMAHHPPNPPPTVWWTNKLGEREKQHFYHSGTMMAGSINTIFKFHKAFLATFQGFLDRKLFVGDDQTVLQCTCLQNPDMCAYVPYDQVADNHYFGLRTALQKGGKYDLWFPPSFNSNTLPEPLQSDTTRLPKAISLLDKPPPYKDSDIHKLSDNLIASPNTVVTAYFKVPSKFKHDSYNGWIKNMLSLQDPMTIFTSPDLLPIISEFRSHAKNRTVIISMNLDDLPIGSLFSTTFWQDQLNRDPEKNIHRSYQLFWIWLSKSWWTTQAIKHNFFQSDLFFWSDMGCFRNQKYNYKTMIQHREQVPRNEMIQMAHHKPNPPDEVFYNDKYNKRANFYHSGSQFAAYKDTWTKFHKYFLDTIDGFLERNMIILEDQAVLQSVCLRYPEICAYVPFNQVKPKDNHYFGLRYVVHAGGGYKLWRHPNNPLASQ